MQKLRAAVWQYYKRFLPLFFLCAVFSLFFQGFARGPIGEAFPVGVPFMSPFFLLFVLCTGNTLDRLFLQMQLPRRTQQKAFLFFLPTAVLGAGASVGIARLISNGVEDSKRGGLCTESYYFQTSLFSNEIFGGSMARITWLAFLLCTLTLLVMLFAGRVLYMLWKSTSRTVKIVLIVLASVTVLFLPIFWFFAVLASEDASTGATELGLGAFFFGNAYSAPSRFSAKAVQLTVLALCLHLLQNGGEQKNRHKVKSPHHTAILCARTAAVCAVAIFGVCTVYYCTPIPVNRVEFNRAGWENRNKSFFLEMDSPIDTDSEEMSLYLPSEKAYRLLQTQEKLAEEPYQAHIARHMVNQYYAPTKAPLPYTDYERGKQYFETAITSDTSYTVFADFPYSSGYSLDAIQNLYCRYLYEGGERDAALAYYTAQMKTPALWETGQILNWMPYLRSRGTSEPTAATVLQWSGNESNFLLFLYLQPNGQDAPFAAREISAFIQTKCTRIDADEGIEQFSLLWDIAQSDAARTALTKEIADYAVLVTDNVTPYSNDYSAKEILKELRALCEKAGAENRLPKGALE